MRILAIETSCDDTAVAVVGDGPDIVSNVLYSQSDAHRRFGGIVPEIASREHIVRLPSLVEEALAQSGGVVDGVAVTSGPGLIGSLLVGLQFAKGFALARGLPWLGVNHLEGHLAASFLGDSKPLIPHVALIVSGGHTHLYAVRDMGRYRLLGGTRDDAAGEAFDKVAKLLGLGYPGGAEVDRCAAYGNPEAYDLPRALPAKASFDFSFSGLKTAVATLVRKLTEDGAKPLDEQQVADVCASAQEAIADVLSKKLFRAAQEENVRQVVIGGGVAANSRVRALVQERCTRRGLAACMPDKSLCTDNAAMIGAAGWLRLSRGEQSEWTQSAQSRWPLGTEAAREQRPDSPRTVGQPK